jgi:hypothetical protein
MADKIDAGVPTKFLVKCEDCGHQAVVGVVVKCGREPSFYCSWCGCGEPLVERIDANRNYKSIR